MPLILLRKGTLGGMPQEKPRSWRGQQQSGLSGERTGGAGDIRAAASHVPTKSLATKPIWSVARMATVIFAIRTCGLVGPGGMLLPWMSSGEIEAHPLEQAMARFAAGDDRALGDVYDLASPAVFTFLLRMSRDRSMAEDLTQETFLRLHRARGLYRRGAAVMPWAYTIARRLFLDAVRSRRSQPDLTAGRGPATGNADHALRVEEELPSSAPSAEELLADLELAAMVDQALAQIPENQAAAFRLLKGEGLSVAETAAIMGTTKGAVKLRAHRAYEALRGLLSRHLSTAGKPRNAGEGTP